MIWFQNRSQAKSALSELFPTDFACVFDAAKQGDIIVQPTLNKSKWKCLRSNTFVGSEADIVIYLPEDDYGMYYPVLSRARRLLVIIAPKLVARNRDFLQHGVKCGIVKDGDEL